MILENAEQSRQIYYDIWDKYQTKQPLEAFEQQLIAIMLQHPEYHFIFEQREKYLSYKFSAKANEINPFFHFALHQVLDDQLTTDRPPGILSIFQQYVNAYHNDTHTAQHAIIEVLFNHMYDTMCANKAFNPKQYLQDLKQNLELTNAKII